MTKFILSGISRLLTVQIEISAIFGLILLIKNMRHDTNKKPFYLLFAFLLWILFSRSFSNISSVRYSSILILPALSLSALFFISLRPRNRYVTYILSTCFVLVVSLCFLKDFKLKSDNGFIVSTAEAIKKKSLSSFPFLTYFPDDREIRRLTYYLGKHHSFIMPDIHYRGPESVSKYYSDSSRSFFVVFDKNSTINNVKTKDSACIFHSYVDRHKKKTISVYSIPVEPEIQHSSLALGKNIMEHGDFSEPCSEQVKSKMTEIFSSVPNKEDFLSDNWMFPAGWGVDILSRKPYTVFEQLYMKDSSNQSNPVLHIDTQTKLCCRYLKRFPMDSDYLLSFDSLSEPGTIFAITVFRFKEKERVYPNVDSGVYFQTDKEWNKHCLIIPKMNGMTSFYVTLNFICGNAFFDNFELRPIL